MPKVLLIGGNRSTVGSIKALRAAGFKIAVAEKLPRQYALAEADFGFEVAQDDVNALRDVIRSLAGIDGVIGINETAMWSAAQLQEEFCLPGLSIKVISRTLSKLAQRQCWAKDEALSVPFMSVCSRKDVQPAVASLGGCPVVIKPDISRGGSRGVSLVSSEDELEEAFSFAEQHCLNGSSVVIERALVGPQYSAELMTENGRTRVLAIGQKIKSAPPARVDLAVCYPGLSDPIMAAAIEEMCAKAKALLGITRGPGHIEFAITQDGPRPIELGARCGGSITPDLAAHVCGYHPMVEAARLACGQRCDGWPNAQSRGAVLMFLAFPAGPVRRLYIPDTLVANRWVLDFDSYLPAGGSTGPIQWTSQRVGYIGIVAATGVAALERARDAAGSIFVERPTGEHIPPLAAELELQGER